MALIVTGSSGLIGSEIVDYFCGLGFTVWGLDNNMRADFFGPEGDTTWNRDRLLARHSGHFTHHTIDIRDRTAVKALISAAQPKLVVHAAAQPSHDLAAVRPLDDFDVNAAGTLNVLEATRSAAPRSLFVYMSTNKVYGDGPNRLKLKELDKRFDYALADNFNGIPEEFGVDQCKHSVFGASKLAADIMVQEYGRYYGMPTCCLRGGCLTGPNHSGVPLHGFLSYLVKCNVQEREYTVYGYKGKQVRDNIHANDVAHLIHRFWMNPRPGEVYNVGGGRDNSCSILEAFEIVESITSKPMRWRYSDKPRVGDHICYISDLSKIKAHFPGFQVTRTLHNIIREIYEQHTQRPST